MKVLLLFLFAGVCAADYVQTIQQNYEALVNSKTVNQITHDLQASYVYEAYSNYFGRADVALPGFAKWFEKASKEEREHATGLIEYVNKRGGSVFLNDIQFSHACQVINANLKTVFPTRQTACICFYMSQKRDKLLKATECELSHVLEQDYLDKEVESIKTIANYVRRLERVGTGVGEYLFDISLK